MLKLILKFIIGVLSIPIAIGTTIAFYNNLVLVIELAGNLNLFLWGIASYVVLHLLFYKPTYLYVLGHEAVHAGTAWLFGGKIKSFKASKDGGAVATDKTNVVIELSPYFVPIYAILISVIYFVVASSYKYKQLDIRISDRIYAGVPYSVDDRSDEDPPAGYSEERVSVFNNIRICAESGRDLSHIQHAISVVRGEEFLPRRVGRFEAYVRSNSQAAVLLAALGSM